MKTVPTLEVSRSAGAALAVLVAAAALAYFLALFHASGLVVGLLRGGERFGLLAAMTLLALAAWKLPRAARVMAPLASGCVLAIVVAGVGLNAAAAAAFVFLAAYGIGAALLRLVCGAEASQGSLASLPLGMCVLVLLGGLGARLGAVTPAASIVILVLCAIAGRAEIIRAATAAWALCVRGCTQASEEGPAARLAAGLFAAAALAAASGAFLPSVNYDDNVFHLRWWTQLASSGRYDFSIENQVWALSPFAANLLHALTSLLAASDARGAVNGILLVLILVDAFRASLLLPLPPYARLLMGALLASTPLLLLATTTLQSEMLLAFAATRAGLALLKQNQTARPISLVEVGASAALLAAAKLPGIVLGGLLLSAWWLSWALSGPTGETVPRRVRYGMVFLGLIGITCAAQAYFFAWLQTGNPVFPLFNAFFRSPLYPPVDFLDTRWTGNGGWSGFVRMFWETSRFLESANGVAGFQYLILLPFLPLAFLTKSLPRPWWSVALVVAVFAALLFSRMQYARYLLPVMPLASLVLAAAAFGASNTTGRLAAAGRASVTVLVVVLTLANLLLAKGVIWYTNRSLFSMLLPEKRAAFASGTVPEQAANGIINTLQGEAARVFYLPQRPYGATLSGQPLYPVWYNPRLQASAASVATAEEAAALLRQFAVSHVVWDTSSELMSGASALVTGLARHLAASGIPVAHLKGVDVYGTSQEDRPLRVLFDLADPAVRKMLSPTGASGPAAAESDALRVDHEAPIRGITVRLDGARVILVEATMACAADAVFLVQVLWPGVAAAPHFRPVTCAPGAPRRFTDLIQAPPGAGTAEVFIRTHSGSPVDVLEYRLLGR